MSIRRIVTAMRTDWRACPNCGKATDLAECASADQAQEIRDGVRNSGQERQKPTQRKRVKGVDEIVLEVDQIATQT
jgi:hypothetical protein